MTIDRIRESYAAEPFQPFVIQLTDGRQVPVRHREFIMASPSGQTIVVCQSDDAVSFIDLPQIADVQIQRTPNGSRRRRQA